MELLEPHSLFWAADSLEFTFTGEALCLIFEADFGRVEPWISAEVNGAPILRMPLNRGVQEVRLFSGMTAGVPKRVRVFKETQPITDDPRHRLLVRGARGTNGAFLPAPERRLCLEFVGDSLTSGEGLAGAREEADWSAALFSASRTWARLTADNLDAGFHAVSQSGWGVCGGWEGDPAHALPRWYEGTRPLRTWEPDAVVVNLGTNDASAIQAGLSSPAAFENGAVSFLRQLRREHPAAKLVWAYGMVDDYLRPQLERAVDRFADAWYLPLPAVTEETMGSRRHPGPACHRQAAEAAVNLLKTIL